MAHSKALLGCYYLMEICVHQVCNDIDGIQLGLGGVGRQNISKSKNMIMSEMAQQLDLSQRSLSVFQVLECVCDLFDGDWLACLQVDGRTGQNK